MLVRAMPKRRYYDRSHDADILAKKDGFRAGSLQVFDRSGAAVFAL